MQSLPTPEVVWMVADVQWEFAWRWQKASSAKAKLYSVEVFCRLASGLRACFA
jgi:hypothetical protein